MSYLGRFSLLLAVLSFTDGQSDVRMPPYITKGPVNATTYRSEVKVELHCKGAGFPDVTYEWKKNGFDLNRNLPNIKSGADGNVIIEPATLMDEGYYQCFVRNQFGTALSITSLMRQARLDSTSGSPTIFEKTVREGEPFHIQAMPRKSFPSPTYGWEIAIDMVDKNPTLYSFSSRVQVDDNGDLYFAYAMPVDALGGRIYKSTTYNPDLDVKAGGSYTNVTVTLAPGGQTLFVPTIGFSSKPQTVGIIGDSVSLRCFFSGNPEPKISWKGPGNTLPLSRYKIDKSDTEITIFNITASDQGDYVCTASNARGQNSQTLQVLIQAKPVFKSSADGPRNINVTDGEEAVFHCNAEAIPGAGVVWLENGEVLDVNAPPKKFAFSGDRKTLTIRSVCRNCEDPNRQTDLTVIQCNASNIHGYAFGSGYLNILAKTQIIPDDKVTMEVELNEEKRVDFDCNAVSDPSTFPTVRWYRTIEDSKELVHDDPPTITLIPKDGEPSLMLSIFVSPNGTDKWRKYQGEYHCVADNGYSSATKLVYLQVNGPQIVASTSSIADWWWIFLIIALIFILLILILCCCIYLQRNKGDKYDVDDKERKNGNDPEKELVDGGFKDYRRPEGQTLRGSRGSLGSSVKLNSDEEASLNEYGDDPGKFTEDGSFVGAYSSGTVDRKTGRNH